MPRVPHFRKDWCPPRRLLVRFNLLKSEIRLPGDGKVHVSANENIAASAGNISFFRGDRGRELEGWGLFVIRQSRVEALYIYIYIYILFIFPCMLDSFTKIFLCHNKIFNSKFTD